jgi:broad specificity phosphatase PhoE
MVYPNEPPSEYEVNSEPFHEQPLLLEILFVRHGYSCANAHQYNHAAFPLYSDPELTKNGINKCIERSNVLKEKIHMYFPDDKYKIGTSCMIRTQQTAYYMLMENTDLKYSIFPHIAEQGRGYDNFPFAQEKQKEFINKLNPDITPRIEHDARGITDASHKSNWDMFLTWIHTMSDMERSKFFHKTEKGVYRAVVFTHGHFINHNLNLENVQNNDVIFTRIDAANKKILVREKLTEFSFPKELKSDVSSCRIKSAVALLNPYGGKTRRRVQRKSRKQRTYKRK